MLTRLERLLSSRKLAISILSVFLLLCILGTLVPQEEVERQAAVRGWNEQHPNLAVLGLTNLFAAWYFLAVVTAGWINILFSTVTVIRRTKTTGTGPAGLRAAEHMANQKSKAVVPGLVTANDIKRIIPFTRSRMNEKKTVFECEQFGFSRWSTVAFHLSLLVLLSGVVLNRATFYRSVYSLVEQDYFVAGKEKPISQEKGFFSRGLISPTKVVLKMVNDGYAVAGYQPGVASEIHLESATEKKDMLVTRADPVRFNGLTIYQSPQYGYAPVFTRIAQDGSEGTGTIRLSRPVNNNDDVRLFTGSGLVPGTDISINCRFAALPAFVGLPEKISVRFLTKGVLAAERTMREGDTIRIGVDRFRLETMRFWADLIVSKQPWLFLIYAGFLGALASLAVFALCDRCIIFGCIDADTRTTTIAVQCLRFRSSEEIVLKRLVTKLQKKEERFHCKSAVTTC